MRATIVEMLCDFKVSSAGKYGIAVLGLFGSAARGELRGGSDIDVRVKLDKMSYHILMDIKEDLSSVQKLI